MSRSTQGEHKYSGQSAIILRTVANVWNWISIWHTYWGNIRTADLARRVTFIQATRSRDHVTCLSMYLGACVQVVCLSMPLGFDGVQVTFSQASLSLWCSGDMFIQASRSVRCSDEAFIQASWSLWYSVDRFIRATMSLWCSSYMFIQAVWGFPVFRWQKQSHLIT